MSQSAVVLQNVLEMERVVDGIRSRLKLDLLKMTETQLKTLFCDLPSHYQNDDVIKSMVRCLDHYPNMKNGGDHVDGPPPTVLECVGCIQARREKKQKKRQKTKPQPKEDDSCVSIFIPEL